MLEYLSPPQTHKTVQQQPKPLPLKRPHALFLEDSVDPLSSSPAPKRYRPESVDSFVTQWVESASGSESYRERHCRSDTLLGHSDGDLIPRRLTKSAPNMEYTQNALGFLVPPTPTATRSKDEVSWYILPVPLLGISSTEIINAVFYC